MSYLGKPGSTNQTILWDGSKFVSGSIGGGDSGPFPFRPVAADFGTPNILFGSGSIAVTDVSGSTVGWVDDIIQITITNPAAGTVAMIPITLPVSPLPDKFDIDLAFYTGAPPANDFVSMLSFLDSSGDLAWSIYHNVNVADTSRPLVRITEVESFVNGASWDLPDTLVGNAVVLQGSIEKVAPFAAIPQIRFRLSGNGFWPNESKVSGEVFGGNPTTGSISAGWETNDFVSASITLVYNSGSVGTVPLYMILGFLPHISSLYS